MMKSLKNFMGNFAKVLYMYKLIWKIDKKYVLIIPVSIFTNAVAPLFTVVIPKFIIDEITNARRPYVLIALVAGLVGVNLFFGFINALYSAYFEKKSDDIKNGLNLLLQEKAMKMDYQYLERPDILDALQKAGEIIHPTQASFMDFQVIISCFNAIISGLMTIVGLIIIISKLSWVLFLIVAAIVIVNYVLNSYVKTKEYETWEMMLTSITRKLVYLQEISVSNSYAKEVRIYNLSDWICGKIADLSANLVEKLKKMFPRYFWVETVSKIIEGILQGGVYLYTGYKCLNGSISIGDLTMYVNAIMNLTQSLNGITQNILNINNAGMYMENFISFIHIDDEIQIPENPISIPENGEHKIVFKNVWFHYPGQQDFILKDISITINTNEKLAIVGDNGAGKTTFIKLLLRLYKPTRGEILLDGINIYDYSYADYIKCFCALFQDFLILSFTLLENIVYDSAENVPTDEIEKILQDIGFLEKLNSLPHGLYTQLSKLFDQDGLELSGGEQQKVALCNSIYRKAPIIILDEPTAMLAPAAEYELYCNFDKIVQKKTAVYISHRMSICRFCDNIAVFEKGQIVEYGNHSELFSQNGLYTKMYDAQAQYYIDLKQGDRERHSY